MNQPNSYIPLLCYELSSLLFYNSYELSSLLLWQALLNHPGGDELLDANDRYGHAPLHVAASKGYMDCVRVSKYTCIWSWSVK